jgi:hypothetical protein
LTGDKDKLLHELRNKVNALEVMVFIKDLAIRDHESANKTAGNSLFELRKELEHEKRRRGLAEAQCEVEKGAREKAENLYEAVKGNMQVRLYPPQH